MSKRKFDKRAYDMCDGPTKVALEKLLRNRGHTILNTKETFNADIISKKNGLVYANEGEMKTAWKAGEDYKYPDVRIPERKARLKEKHESQVLNFYVFRADFKVAWRIKDTELTEDVLKEAKGRWIHPGEKFFTIPVENCELVYVKKED